MASSTNFHISQKEYNLFYKIDRDLYTILALNLWRDPVESVQVMALWLWLERVGYTNVVYKTLALPHILINELADEAISCLNIINDSANSSSGDNPLMQCLMDKNLSFRFFHKHRLAGATGVPKIIKQVCMRAFSDLVQLAIEKHSQKAAQAKAKAEAEAKAKAQVQQVMQQQALIQPMVRQVIQTADLGLGAPMMMRSSDVLGLGMVVPPNRMIHPDDRTMFLTFSKGYPVFEWEVREFFSRAYGDCIESLHMQEVLPFDQPLFARIVFHSPNTIDKVLNGTGKAKFTINGKHVWARKFVPKRPRDVMPPLASPAPGPSASPPLNFPLQFGSFDQNFVNVEGVVLGQAGGGRVVFGQSVAGSAVEAPFFSSKASGNRRYGQ